MRTPPARLASELASPPGFPCIDGLRSAKFDDATVPESGVFPLGAGEVAQNLGADRVGVAVGEGFIGVIALHLGLPVGFEGSQNFFQLGAAQGGDGHGASPCVLLRIRHFAEDFAVSSRREKWKIRSGNEEMERDDRVARGERTKQFPASLPQFGVLRIVLCAAK